ncbi:orotidine 5'-phosphate decarboxylase / HUMPS family protein, partial [Salmonella enterica]
MSLPMLQVALDNQTMDSAYETTRLIAEEVDIIEVGTILCVREAERAVRALQALYPHKSELAAANIP